MDDPHRMQTLHALEMFIHTQRTLLAQQRADIDRLQRLRVELVQRPAHVLANLGRELDDDAFRLSEQVSCRLALPKDIDWSVFEKSDTGPLRTLAQQKRDELAQRSRPSPTQSSAQLSELQRFVKRSRRTIVDPVLARCAALSAEIESDNASEEEEEEDPEALRRREEQQKIRELKTRMIRGGGGGLRVPLSSTAGAMGVFVRPDVEEAAMDVDVSIDDDDEGENGKGKGANGVVPLPLALDVDSDTPSPPPLPAKAAVVPVPPGKKMKGSVRRHAGKKNLPPPPVFDNAAEDDNDDEEDEAYGLPPLPQKQLPPGKIVKLKIPARPKRVMKHDEGEDEDDGDDYGEPIATAEDEAKPKTKGRRAGNAKPKPETYKQAWSESEQNLLEQLLEEIPEGEKFRWQKISRAMGGRRTPRQVASRVQKYFEKLKRFGLMVDGCGGG